MRRRARRWGNSLAVRIPAEIAQACRISEGTPLEVKQDAGRVVLIPEAPRRRKYVLGDLVSRITNKNRPQPVDFGRRVGREVW